MATLIFDIETVGEEWESLDGTTQHSLTRWVDKIARTKEEREALVSDIKAGLGFSPLTGQIVALGLYDLERAQGVVYYQGEAGMTDIPTESYTYRVRTETELLRDFWDGARHYDTFVTFNGRAFDAPFLFHRSVVCGVVPTKNLLEGRYPAQQRSCRHVDLQDELTFYGAISRRPSLHLFCRAYGIASSKEEMSGDEVATLFRDHRYLDIARYNAADVTATKELYERWLAYRPVSSEADIEYGTL